MSKLRSEQLILDSGAATSLRLRPRNGIPKSELISPRKRVSVMPVDGPLNGAKLLSIMLDTPSSADAYLITDALGYVVLENLGVLWMPWAMSITNSSSPGKIKIGIAFAAVLSISAMKAYVEKRHFWKTDRPTANLMDAHLQKRARREQCACYRIDRYGRVSRARLRKSHQGYKSSAFGEGVFSAQSAFFHGFIPRRIKTGTFGQHSHGLRNLPERCRGR